MSLEQSTLSAFMDAVTNYYGGADIWTGITDAGAFTSAEFAAKVTQVDGVTAMYNAAGDVLYYKYNDQIVANAVDLANTINSNVGSTVASNSVNIPANTAVGTGNVVAASSGMQTAGGATVATVVKDVALGVAAVGAGIQLGAAIDGALYNLNPDFWDENNMSSLNPQTWDTLVSDYGETGQKVFNMVFGINKTTNKVQPYMNERALAYIAQYMISQGVWDTGEQSASYDFPSPSVKPNVEQPINFVDIGDFIVQDGQNTYTFAVTSGTGNVKFYGWLPSPTSRYYLYVIASDQPNTVVTRYLNGSPAGTYTPSNTWTYDNKTVYYVQAFSFDKNTATLPPHSYDNVYDSTGDYAVSAWIIEYGNIQGGGGVEGITQQDGSTPPTGITPQMSIDDVIARLQILYPDLFTNKITNSVVQPDGSVVTHIYVPVSIPENVPLDDVTNALKPTGGTEFTQGQTTIDPTITPDDLIDTLLKIMTSTDPYSPTQTPTDTPTDYPNTGEGNTPAIVLPDGQASALYSIYNPSQSQINALGAWLWSSNFVDQLLKLFNDPMQAIIGLHKVFATPPTSGTGTIKVGYLDSGVGANLVSAQYTEVDCGTVSLKEYFGNVLDYTDTDIYLYLPFVGIVPVSTLDVVRSKINVKYKVDVLTGACMAQVYVNRDNNAGGQLYCYAGDCAVKYPLSSGSYMGIVSSVLGIAGGVVGTIASGGAMLPLALGAGASALNSARAAIEHSGSLSGNAGAMGIKKPYFIIRRPQTKIANDFHPFNGQSNNVFDVLGNCTGYTRVKYVNLENIPATGDELTEIENLLKSGVII